ncbi:MAG: hypothetical protein AAFZ65_18600 [Planctomycetota bacterium]
MGRYTTPKPRAGQHRSADASRRRGPVVHGPEDLIFTDEIPAEGDSAGAVDSADLERMRERAAQLEGAVEASSRLEQRATAELERVREDQRTAAEAARRELAETRERHERELRGLRELLDQRERELRTLALEMGVTRGRLEVAERRLLEAPSPAPGATIEEVGPRFDRQRVLAAALMLAVALGGSVVILRGLGWMPVGDGEVSAQERHSDRSADGEGRTGSTR